MDHRHLGDGLRVDEAEDVPVLPMLPMSGPSGDPYSQLGYAIGQLLFAVVLVVGVAIGIVAAVRRSKSDSAARKQWERQQWQARQQWDAHQQWQAQQQSQAAPPDDAAPGGPGSLSGYS